jgi:hypothetical protein
MKFANEEQAKAYWEKILSDCDISHQDAVRAIERHGKPVTVRQATQDRVIGKKVRAWMAANGYDDA